jgi:hypothetical protein
VDEPHDVVADARGGADDHPSTIRRSLGAIP